MLQDTDFLQGIRYRAPVSCLKQIKVYLVIGTNAINITSDHYNTSFITFNTMNSLTTSNQTFCEEMDHWIKNLMKKSTLISGSAEKQRFRFFNQMHKQISGAEEKIKNF